MKKFVAAATAAVLSFTTMASLAACGKKDIQKLTNAQWLSMINQSFGMSGYTEEEPYFENISSDSPYFSDVQTATEWNVIDASEDFDPEDTLSWGEAYVTLVNAGEFTDEKASDMDKIKYGIANFGVESRTYWRNRDISAEDAIKMLSTAQEKWAGRTYTDDEKVEKVKYSEGVVDLTTDDSPVEQYSINGNIVSIPSMQDLGDGTTSTVSQEDLGIKSGDVYVLPANGTYLGDTACRAENVYEENGEIKIENSEEDLDLYDIAEEIQLKETMEPTMENCVVYDGNGEVISVGNNISPEVTAEMNSAQPTLDDLTNKNDGKDMFESTGFDVSHSFDIGDGWSVELKYGVNGKLDLAANVKYKKESESKKQAFNFSAGSALNDFKVTTDVDYKWFSLNSAEVKVDYKQTQTYKADVSTSGKWTGAPDNNRNTNFLKNLKKSIVKDINADGAKTIASRKTLHIASLDIYNAGIAKVCLDVNFEIKVDGSIELTITEVGSKGVSYKNGKLRLINTSNKDRAFKAQASVEATMKIGPALYVMGLKKKILGFDLKVGIGGKYTGVLHMADPDMVLIEETSGTDLPPTATPLLVGLTIPFDASAIEDLARMKGGTYNGSGTVSLHIDSCSEVTLYFILGVEFSTDSYASDLLGSKISFSGEILSEKNARFATVHCDNGVMSGVVLGNEGTNLCTLKYKDFDGKDADSSADDSSTDSKSNDSSAKSSSDSEDTSSNEIAHGEKLNIMQLKTIIDPGETTAIIIQQLPYGYEMSDIQFSSDDPDIVTVNGSGEITAVASGNALITIKTSDGKNMAYAAVTVTDSHNTSAA